MALIFIIIGAIILLCPQVISNIFNVVLGIWIIISGIKNFQTALIWKNVRSGYWTAALLFSMITIIAGIAILVSTTLALRVVGIIILVYAIMDIATRMIFMKKVKDYLKD